RRLSPRLAALPGRRPRRLLRPFRGYPRRSCALHRARVAARQARSEAAGAAIRVHDSEPRPDREPAVRRPPAPWHRWRAVRGSLDVVAVLAPDPIPVHGPGVLRVLAVSVLHRSQPRAGAAGDRGPPA